uniref:3-hydroxyisobutyryl-CoA hydrolase n=1 Tax=Quercus lobata TaxID=97700 RepID=A0A7N2LD32_QUELO
MIRQGRLQGVGQCLVREYRMVCHVVQGKLSRDFFEGCRAILWDKDKNPKPVSTFESFDLALGSVDSG